LPCVFPGSKRIVYVPLTDFHETYQFFTESRHGVSELTFFLRKLHAGDIIFDIGAYRGAYGVAAKAVFGDSVAVHLFEPIEKNLSKIRAIAQLNDFRLFEVVGKAVSSSNTVKGTIDLQDVMLRRENAAAGETWTEFPSITVDGYVTETGVIPSVIKLDVEGFELDVLEGARKCLAKYTPRLWLELHPSFLAEQGHRWERAIEILNSLGYGKTTFFKDYEQPTRDLAFHVWCEK
jgi:FkbM family methyltransferase